MIQVWSVEIRMARLISNSSSGLELIVWSIVCVPRLVLKWSLWEICLRISKLNTQNTKSDK